MLKGDISNAFTQRVLVTTDLIITTEVSVKKILRIIPRIEKTYSYNIPVLSRIYLYANRTEYTFELISYDLNQPELDELLEDLEKSGTNPFRYSSAYDSIDQLVTQLPYRPEVVGVMDRPDRLLRYGSWGLDVV